MCVLCQSLMATADTSLPIYCMVYWQTMMDLFVRLLGLILLNREHSQDDWIPNHQSFDAHPMFRTFRRGWVEAQRWRNQRIADQYHHFRGSAVVRSVISCPRQKMFEASGVCLCACFAKGLQIMAYTIRKRVSPCNSMGPEKPSKQILGHARLTGKPPQITWGHPSFWTQSCPPRFQRAYLEMSWIHLPQVLLGDPAHNKPDLHLLQNLPALSPPNMMIMMVSKLRYTYINHLILNMRNEYHVFLGVPSFEKPPYGCFMIVNAKVPQTFATALYCLSTAVWSALIGHFWRAQHSYWP